VNPLKGPRSSSQILTPRLPTTYQNHLDISIFRDGRSANTINYPSIYIFLMKSLRIVLKKGTPRVLPVFVLVLTFAVLPALVCCGKVVRAEEVAVMEGTTSVVATTNNTTADTSYYGLTLQPIPILSRKARVQRNRGKEAWTLEGRQNIDSRPTRNPSEQLVSGPGVKTAGHVEKRSGANESVSPSLGD
jgi:hypothetical protein